MAATALFPLGRLVATPGALQVLGSPAEAGALLARHRSGDWGDVCAADQRENDYSVEHGFRILSAIFTLLRDYRPLSFFGGAGIICVVLGLLPGLFVTYEFTQRGTVRIPTAVLATGLVLSGLILMLVGVMLTALNRRFRELDHRLTGLADEVRKGGQS